MWYMHDGMGWWMVFGGLLWLLFWILVVVLIVWAIKRLTQRGESKSHPGDRRDPLDIAKERYAKGEISREQFEQIKKDLHGP